MSTVPNSDSDSNSKPSVYLQSMEETQKVFNRFDTNGDGKISDAELAGVLHALGSVTSEDEVRRIMDEIDTDRDGFINVHEFAAFFGSGGGSESTELRDAFDMYDKDKNGLISAEELHLVLSRLGEKCSVEDCSGMIKSFDSDGDGNVSFEEFKQMMNTSAK